MFSLFIFIIILSTMILVHEFGHFIVARKLGIRVEQFSLGFGKRLLSCKRNATEYSLCLIPMGGFVKLAGDTRDECKGEKHEFLSRKPWERALVILAGPVLNYILAFLCFWMVNVLGYPYETTKVGAIKQGYPAYQAGIQKGDVISSVDGKQVKYFKELQESIHNKNTPSVEIEIVRGVNKIKLIVGLRQEVVKNLLGANQKISLIGIIPSGEAVLVKHSLGQGFILAGKNLLDLTVLTLKALGRMFTGAMSFKENVTGLVGMYFVTSSALSVGFNEVLKLIAVLSASLAIFNVLPFPVLDGGHLFFLCLEKLRGRQLNQKIEEQINRVGFGFIIALGVFVFVNDLVNFGIVHKIVTLLGK